MLYYKPKDVSYTDMCIWIDNNAYAEDCDKEKLFKYIYLLAEMLAFKGRMFKSGNAYDDFAVYIATRVYSRYVDKNQFVCKKGRDKPKLKKIKSVLNYLKKIIYPAKITFEQNRNQQNIEIGEQFAYDLRYDFHSRIRDTVHNLKAIEYSAYIQDIVPTIKSHIDNVVKYEDRTTKNNIYLSCLLSFLNSVVLSNKAKEKIDRLTSDGIKQSAINRMYQYERSNSTILYHLDDSYKDYIAVLVNEVRQIIAKDMSSIMQTDIYSDSLAEDLLQYSFK